jgi:hypothetical protein
MLDNVRPLPHSYPLLCDQLLKRVMTRRLSSVDVKHIDAIGSVSSNESWPRRSRSG